MSDRELRPASRFEWEQIIRRARLDGLIGGSGKLGKDGRPTRGAIAGKTFKAAALTWASYGNPDGSSIHPGDATWAVESEVGLKDIKAIKAFLIEVGLTERIKAGSRRLRQPDIYRLTLPSDLLERVHVLSPAALKLAAIETYEKQRGKRGGSTGPLKDPVGTPDVEGPPDPPQDDPLEIVGGPEDPRNDVVGGPEDQLWGVRRTAIPNQDRATNRPDQPTADVRTAVTGPRATPPEEALSPPTNTPTSRTRCGHGLSAGRRPDGRPVCALCRVEQDRAARHTQPPAPSPTQLAQVIHMRRSSA